MEGTHGQRMSRKRKLGRASEGRGNTGMWHPEAKARESRRREGSRVLDATRRAGAGSVGFSGTEVSEVSH